ncbi:MAG: biosynthetic arginine decarboxylase [Opitutales bacterium]
MSNPDTTDTARFWTAEDAENYYGFNRWGAGHFSVDGDGNLRVHPQADSRAIRLMDVLAEAREMGLKPPLTVRVQDMLQYRIAEINHAFREAIAQENYEGRYRGVFPIKVNQLREVVEEIVDAGKPFDAGLEAGSKPELMIALAQMEKPGSLIICNGYKDDDYIRLALLGRRLGKEVILVIEQFSEVESILRVSREMDVAPQIGLRLKLRVESEGKWATSSGESAKFGLSAAEVAAVSRRLKRAGMADCLELVHFHIGSQVPSILPLKKAVIEATRYYCELRRMGFPLRYLDVGGGLGIDYDGSRSNFESSMNYSVREYARDVVFNIRNVCAEAEAPVPDIISESGRAIVGSHSLLVVEVTDRIAKLQSGETPPPRKRDHQILRYLQWLLREGSSISQLERYHDALQKKDEAASLFSLGYLDLDTRARAETLFWTICQDIHREVTEREGYIPEELEELTRQLAEQYVGNFSVFQSLVDHWALGQLFPIAPLHRLNERPSVETTLVDITCDSDGKVATFIDLEDVKHTLRLHEFRRGEPYYLGIFLVGAYQDIMGDLHNLFGRVNELHIFLEEDEEDGFYIEQTINGYNTSQVLNMIQHDSSELSKAMKAQVDNATRDDRVKPREGVRLLTLYNQLLEDKTYLTPPQSDQARSSSAKTARAARAARKGAD